MVLHRPLVREPQQRAPVVAERVRDLALGRLRPDRNRPNQSGVYFGTFFCMNGAVPADPDDGQRSLLQPGQDRIADGVEVIDEVALGRARPVEQRLVQMSERYAVAILAAAHSLTLPPDMPLVVVVLQTVASSRGVREGELNATTPFRAPAVAWVLARRCLFRRHAEGMPEGHNLIHARLFRSR